MQNGGTQQIKTTAAMRNENERGEIHRLVPTAEGSCTRHQGTDTGIELTRGGRSPIKVGIEATLHRWEQQCGVQEVGEIEMRHGRPTRVTPPSQEK